MSEKGVVLVVEDDEAMCGLISRVLSHAGFEVKTADNGLEALKTIDAEPPDVVVCDVMMPELDGIDMARGLRSHATTNELPIIFVTASDNPQHLIQSIEVKARQFLSKPFDNKKLIDLVAKAVQASRRAKT